MAKIKLSLPSGSEVEKPVISYFSNGGNYLVLDGESVGSMGLPIILVSKVNGNKAEKIVDQNEWQQVKGYLKNIISGSPTTYLAAPDGIPADETYYTQLTLPVASFDSLKNSYVVPAADAASPAIPDSAPAPVNPSPVAAANTPVETSPAPVDAAPDITAAPVASAPIEAVPVVDTPATPEPAVTDTAASGDMQPVNMSTEIAPEAPVLNVPTPEAPIVDTSVTPEAGTSVANPVVGEEPIANEALSASEPAPAPVEAVPVAETPSIEEPMVETTPLPDPAATEVPTIDPVVSDPVVSEPVVGTDLPAVDSVTTPQDNMDIDAVKQKFMHACEELFESLAALTKK